MILNVIQNCSQGKCLKEPEAFGWPKEDEQSKLREQYHLYRQQLFIWIHQTIYASQTIVFVCMNVNCINDDVLLCLGTPK